MALPKPGFRVLCPLLDVVHTHNVNVDIRWQWVSTRPLLRKKKISHYNQQQQLFYKFKHSQITLSILIYTNFGLKKIIMNNDCLPATCQYLLYLVLIPFKETEHWTESGQRYEGATSDFHSTLLHSTIIWCYFDIRRNKSSTFCIFSADLWPESILFPW